MKKKEEGKRKKKRGKGKKENGDRRRESERNLGAKELRK